ncbi:Uncharacterised protein [Mycobacterium tuberculosis]|nr:Uncharacterised protein [Mycobacterium tuberculosis]CKT10035.1 Uncharacterised protein [Mycobacterium tuberculosis]COY36363.1 Uncharacterised protein [Mycobacterium tuberculosis]
MRDHTPSGVSALLAIANVASLYPPRSEVVSSNTVTAQPCRSA